MVGVNLLNCLGVGIVTSTKETNSDEVMVHIPSLFPTSEGRGSVEVDVRESSSLALDGTNSNARVLKANSVPAKWLRMGDVNRITPPDVREGSRVGIYQIEGQNQYYWTTQGMNAETLRLETVIYGWSGNPNINEDTPFNIDNFYTLTVSTHEGEISLRTTDANGEATTFQIKLDTKTGKLYVVGKNQSSLVLDDVNRRLFYNNKDGTTLDINQKVISAYAPESINLISEKELVVSTKNIKIKAAQMDLDIPITNWKGDVKHLGNKQQDGSQTSTGKIHSDSDVTSRVSLNEHDHGGVETGKGNTAKPN